MERTEHAVVLITVPNDKTADSIANTLVSERLAACVNILPAIRSIYRWNDEIQTDSELLLVVKTKRELFEQLKEKVLTVHPYDVPEVVMLPIIAGNASYLRWISESVL